MPRRAIISFLERRQYIEYIKYNNNHLNVPLKVLEGLSITT